MLFHNQSQLIRTSTSLPVGSRLFMCHPKGMSQLVQHGAHGIAAGRLEVQPLGLAMCQLSHVGPTARVFLGENNGKRLDVMVKRPFSWGIPQVKRPFFFARMINIDEPSNFGEVCGAYPSFRPKK